MRRNKEPYWITQIKLEGVVLRLYENIVVHKAKHTGPGGIQSFWPKDPFIAENIKLLERLWKDIQDSEGKE